MRILFLTQVLPYPLDAGPKVRAYYVLRHLAQHGEVTLISFCRASDSPDAVEHLRRFCSKVVTVPISRIPLLDAWYLIWSIITGRPFLIVRDWRKQMMRVIEHEVSTSGVFDIIHADQLWMAPYALGAREAHPKAQQPRTILDQHNAVYLIPARLAQGTRNWLKQAFLRREAKRLARYESTICERFDRTVFVSQQDRSALEAVGFASQRPERTAVIPICVEPSAANVARTVSQRIVFIGGMHWPPNAEGAEWFVRSVWPLVKKALPEARLALIGKNPPVTIDKLRDPLIELPGYVADGFPLLEGAGVMIVPLFSGGGVRVKILDAWSQGVPVVSTQIGAEGLEARTGENILLADTASDFADAVVSVLNNPVLARQIAEAGKKTVVRHYDWRNRYGAWDEVYGCEFSSSYHMPQV